MPARLHADPAPVRASRTPAADLGTLHQLGRVPPPRKGRGRERPPRRPQPQQTAHETMLLDALQQAGVRIAPRDTAAVTAVATLGTATVGTVVQWIRRGTPPPPLPPAET